MIKCMELPNMTSETRSLLLHVVGEAMVTFNVAIYLRYLQPNINLKVSNWNQARDPQSECRQIYRRITYHYVNGRTADVQLPVSNKLIIL